MYPILVVSIFVALITFQIASFRPAEHKQQQFVTADVMAMNFWSYQRAVAEYVYLNKGFTGTANLEDLLLPNGYVHTGNWSHIAENDTLYTFSNAAISRRAVDRIAQRGRGAIVGLAQDNGQMLVLQGKATVTNLPSVIPAGSVVVIGK